MDVPLEGALALYNLTAATVFREPNEDSKVTPQPQPDGRVLIC